MSVNPSSRMVAVISARLIAAEFQESGAAGTEPPNRYLCCAHEPRRAPRPAVEREAGFVRTYVPREEGQLLGRHVGHDGGEQVHAPAELGRERPVEVSLECPDPVPQGAGDRDRVDVGADHHRAGMRRAEHRGHGTAPGAQVDGDPVGRQQLHRPPSERFGVRTRHEHARIDPDPDPAERHRARDPRERLPLRSARDQRVDRTDAFTGGREQGVGLGFGRDEPTGGQRGDSALPLPWRRLSTHPPIATTRRAPHERRIALAGIHGGAGSRASRVSGFC